MTNITDDTEIVVCGNGEHLSFPAETDHCQACGQSLTYGPNTTGLTVGDLEGHWLRERTRRAAEDFAAVLTELSTNPDAHPPEYVVDDVCNILGINRDGMANGLQLETDADGNPRAVSGWISVYDDDGTTIIEVDGGEVEIVTRSAHD